MANIIITLIDVDTLDGMEESANVRVETDTDFPDDPDEWSVAMRLVSVMLEAIQDEDDEYNQPTFH